MSKTTEVSIFKYEQLDEHTADFLRRKETNMREIVGKAYTDLGRELKEAQDELAKRGYGCFLEWLDYVGIERRKAYRLIDRHKLVLDNLSNTDLIEDLPVSLTYEIAKPSAEDTPVKAQAKSEVLAGEIGTLKAYKERIKELENKLDEAESQAEQALKRAEQAEQREPDVKIVEKTVEIDRTDYEALDRLRRYEEKWGLSGTLEMEGATVNGETAGILAKRAGISRS